MKNRLSVLSAFVALLFPALAQVAAQTPAAATPAPSATPAPVIVINGALDSATATTVAQARAKQQLAAISAQGFRQLQTVYLSAYNVIYKNRDGLTPAQVLAILSTADAATLQSLQSQLFTLLNNIAPGSVPAPPQQ